MHVRGCGGLLAVGGGWGGGEGGRGVFVGGRRAAWGLGWSLCHCVTCALCPPTLGVAGTFMNLSANSFCELALLHEGGLSSVVRLVSVDTVDEQTAYNCVWCVVVHEFV